MIRNNPTNPSPLRLRYAMLLAAVLTVLGVVAMPTLDLIVAHAQKAYELPGELRRLVAFSEVFAHGLGVLLIILVCVAVDTRHWRIAPTLLATAYLAGLTANLCKLLVARVRPYAMDLPADDVWRTFQGWFLAGDSSLQSFPSGHSATAAGFAMGLACLYPRWIPLWASLAILACSQRSFSSSHYLSDILIGAALGIIVAATMLNPRLPLGRFLEKMRK